MRVWQGVLPGICLVIAVVCLYAQFLWNPIVFDDLPFFSGDGFSPIENYHWSWLELRSLPYATLNWNVQLLGLGMRNLRLGNLGLHLSVALALYGYLRELLEYCQATKLCRATKTNEISNNWLVASAVLLFALNPVAVYAVAYLVQRTILLATLFSVLAMWVYLRGSVRQQTAWLWLCVPFYYLAAFSKEHAIMLPAVLLVCTVLLHQDWVKQLQQRWTLFVALGLVALWVIMAKAGVLGSVYEVAAGGLVVGIDPAKIFYLSVLTQAWLFFKYVLLWCLPNPSWMSVDMREPFASSWWSVYLLAGFVYLLWGGLALRWLFQRGQYALFGFAMLIPWLLFMTEFSTVRIQEIMVLYRSYLWMIGLPIILIYGLSFFRKRMFWLLTVILIGACFLFSMDRLSTFSHPFLLWDDASRLLNGRDDMLGASRIYNNRGNELLKLGKYDEAISDLRKTLSLSPNMPSAYNNLGVAYLKQGRNVEAMQAFSRSIEIMEKSGVTLLDTRPLRGRARAYEANGQFVLALEDYRRACQIAQKECAKITELQAKLSVTKADDVYKNK